MKRFELFLNLALIVVGVTLFSTGMSEMTTLEVPSRDADVLTMDTPTLIAEDTETPRATPTPTETPITQTIVLTSQILFATPTPPAPTATPTITPLPTATVTKWFSNTLALANTINIALLGSDHRPGDPTWRTDTIIVVAIDPVAKSAGAISVPRDMWVDIPNHAPNRVNALDEFGGPPLVKKVLGTYLGMPIDYYVRVDFDGFQKAIDTIGGITVNVDCPLSEGYPDPSKPDGIRHVYFPTGKVQMDGQMALDFSRSRLSTSVYDRMRRQMKVLLAVREKLLSADMFLRIPALWNAATKLVQTDIPASQILPLARLGSELKVSDLHALTIDLPMVYQTYSVQGYWILMPNVDRIHAAVGNLFKSQTVSDAVKKQGGCG